MLHFAKAGLQNKQIRSKNTAIDYIMISLYNKCNK